MSRESLTPAQNVQEALDLERERDRHNPCSKEAGGLQKQNPTPEAITVLHNEAGRHKAISSRRNPRARMK